MTLDNKYKIKPFFCLEKAKEISKMEVESNIYKIKPEFTDMQEFLKKDDAYIVAVHKLGRFYAYDKEGGFTISEDTFIDCLELFE
jgi:hypothetical protein